MIKNRILGAAAALIASIGFAAAQQSDPDVDLVEEALASDGWHGLRAVGGGIVALQNPYLGVENEYNYWGFPMVAFRRDRITFEGKQVAYRLTPDESPLVLEALLDLRFQAYNDDDSPALRFMVPRKPTLEGGGKLTYEFGDLDLSTQVRYDLLGEHQGYDVVTRADYDWRVFRGTWFRPYAGVSLRSANMIDYYFGVNPSEALDGSEGVIVDGQPFVRPTYLPGKSVNPFVGAQLRQGFSRKLFMIAFVHHHFYSDEIKESPIVANEGELAAGLIFVRPFL